MVTLPSNIESPYSLDSIFGHLIPNPDSILDAIKQKEDIYDSGYWSSDELPLEESDEVTDSYFYDHLFDKNDCESPPKENLPTSDYDLKSPPEDLKSPPEHLKSPPEDVQSVDD